MFTSQLKRRKLKYHDQFALVVGVLYDGVSLSLVVANYPLSHFLPYSIEKRVLDGIRTDKDVALYIYVLKEMLFEDEQCALHHRILYSQLD